MTLLLQKLERIPKKLNVKPCTGCLECKLGNICKVRNNFSESAEKVRKADAIVVGGYNTPRREIFVISPDFDGDLSSLEMSYNLP